MSDISSEDAQAISEQLGRIYEQLVIMNSRPIPYNGDDTLLILGDLAEHWRDITFMEVGAIRERTRAVEQVELSNPAYDDDPAAPKRVTLDDDQVIGLIMSKTMRGTGLRAALTIPPSGEVLKAMNKVRNDADSLDVRNVLDRYPHPDNLPNLINSLAREKSNINRQNILIRTIMNLGEAALSPLINAAQDHADNYQLGETLVELVLKLDSPIESYATSFPNVHTRIAAALALIREGNSSILELIFDDDHPDTEVQEAVANELIGYALPEYGTSERE